MERAKSIISACNTAPDLLVEVEAKISSLLSHQPKGAATAEEPMSKEKDKTKKNSLSNALGSIGVKKIHRRTMRSGSMTDDGLSIQVANESGEGEVLSEGNAQATLRVSVKKRFEVAMFHMQNALNNIASLVNVANKVRINVVLLLPGPAEEFRGQDGLCFAVEAVDSPTHAQARKAQRRPRILLHGGHLEQPLKLQTQRDGVRSSCCALVVHNALASLLVNRSKFDYATGRLPPLKLPPRGLFNGNLDVLVILRSRVHSLQLGEGQTRVCTLLQALRASGLRCSFNVNQLVSGPMSMQLPIDRIQRESTLTSLEFKQLYNLRIPIVVLLTQTDANVANVFDLSQGKDARHESLSVNDLPEYLLSVLLCNDQPQPSVLEREASTISTFSLDTNATPRNTAYLVVSSGVFSSRDPKKEAYRRGKLIEEKVGEYLNSLLGSTFTIVSVAQDDKDKDKAVERAEGESGGPLFFASSAGISDLMYFHSVLRTKGATNLDLSHFSEDARADRRHWLKPLLAFVRNKAKPIFLYSIGDDDCVIVRSLGNIK